MEILYLCLAAFYFRQCFFTSWSPEWTTIKRIAHTAWNSWGCQSIQFEKWMLSYQLIPGEMNPPRTAHRLIIVDATDLCSRSRSFEATRKKTESELGIGRQLRGLNLSKQYG